MSRLARIPVLGLALVIVVLFASGCEDGDHDSESEKREPTTEEKAAEMEKKLDRLRRERENSEKRLEGR